MMIEVRGAAAAKKKWSLGKVFTPDIIRVHISP